MNDARQFIIGIDPGTKTVGYAVLSLDGWVAKVGEWTLGTSKEKVWIRLARLGPKLAALLYEWEPVVVACEITRPFKGNLHTHLVLGASIGVVISQAATGPGSGACFMPVNPMQIRKTKIHKKNLERAAEFAGRAVTGDEADALGCAEWARRQIVVST